MQLQCRSRGAVDRLLRWPPEDTLRTTAPRLHAARSIQGDDPEARIFEQTAQNLGETVRHHRETFILACGRSGFLTQAKPDMVGEMPQRRVLPPRPPRPAEVTKLQGFGSMSPIAQGSLFTIFVSERETSPASEDQPSRMNASEAATPAPRVRCAGCCHPSCDRES